MKKLGGILLAFASMSALAGQGAPVEQIDSEQRMEFVRDGANEKLRSGISRLHKFRVAGITPAPEMCQLFWQAADSIDDNLKALEADKAYATNSAVIGQRQNLTAFTGSITERCGARPANNPKP